MKTTSIVIAFILLIMACTKDKNESSGHNCSSSIPSYQDTVTIDQTNYSIVANYSGAQSILTIELIGYRGQDGVTLTVDFMQVKKGTNCYESSSSTILSGSDSMVYEFTDVPSWANDVSASAFIKVTINGVEYYLHDPKVNQ